MKNVEIKRGIYLVANLKSELFCENLISSIRRSGCTLPIRLIHFGGEPVRSGYILGEVEPVDLKKLPEQAYDLIAQLQQVLTDCPRGFLLRFLSWFGDWDEFIYSDNDIVALCNWEILFNYLSDHDLVHADREYMTQGKFNYIEPDVVTSTFGPESLNSAFTAGHFAVRRDPRFIDDLYKAIEWFRANPSVAKKHDQSLLHIASLIGKWDLINLCKPPYNWLSSWAGDYSNGLSLIHALQIGNMLEKRSNISHIHYSGRTPSGTQPIDEFLFSYSGQKFRLRSLIMNGSMELSGIAYLLLKKKRLERRIKNFVRKRLRKKD